MDLKNFLFILLAFVLLFVFFKKTNLLVDNVNYSNHKKIGAENESPIVFGGLYLLIVFLFFFYEYSIYLTSSLFFITLLGFMSDKNVLSNPRIRLILQIILIISLSFFENLQINDLKFDFFNLLLSDKYFNLFFTVFCLAVLVNGSNFLDGLNGLLTGYYLIILISLIFLTNSNEQIEIINYNFLNIIFFILLIFYIFNIFGLAYLGDSGSYFLSLLIGFYLIKLNNNFDSISPYYIAVLLWYPAFENLFSLSRRILKKQNASSPDNLHLHQLIYLFLKSKKIISKKMLNSICGILILLINLPGILIANNFPTKSLTLISIIIFNLSMYIFLYYFFSKNFVFKK